MLRDVGVLRPSDFSHRLGGPVGPRGRRDGRWFDPTNWSLVAATLTWLVLMVRQVPCRPIDGHFPDAFLRLCYSDIPTLFLGRGISTGAGLYSDAHLEYPVLTGYFMELARTITSLLGGQVNLTASQAEQAAASQLFFQVNAVLLFACFVGTVLVHLRIGGPYRVTVDGMSPRAWDALLIAVSPLVMATGLINWDLFAVLLTSWGLLVWSRRRPFLAGCVFGLAFAAKFYPILVLIAIALLCVRAGRHADLLRVWVGALLSWLLVNLPVLVLAPQGWLEFWTKNADRGADLGSIWYVLHLMGLTVPALSAVAFACMAAGGIAVVWLTLRAPRRPRLAQVAALLLIIFLVFNKVYSPQYMLWLLPLMVLARPVVRDLAVWTVGEICYFVAIWGFLQGLLGPGSTGEWAYWMAVLVRVSCQLWFALRVLDDLLHPWQDPVRRPLVDDPVGGVLNHAADNFGIAPRH